ncbi:hypothetical protein [Nocardiopsis sp. CNT312]|uniref:hypothetical protein n=1 Tax=Nocardiopsis sp. CNT312 TaxID=1137268 RepID=UPI0004B0523E|nr:hypothetical protein [Nocardiopsis sp. CNT312]
MKTLAELDTEELSALLAVLDEARPHDTALRLALYRELRRAAAEEAAPARSPRF